MVNFTMIAYGAAESQTIYIEIDFDDGFVLETGNGFYDGPLVTILDPNMDITAYLVFRMIEINSFELLTNATLRLRTAGSLPFDADSSVTIYGVKDGEFPGFGSFNDVLSAPLTFAHVNYNTSEFYGSSWKEIDVTNIVAELKSSPTWEGDGPDGTAIPGVFGFKILGAEGSDTRHFYDFGAGNGLEAQLVIHWGEPAVEPPPSEKPPGQNTTDFVWTYENTTIAYDPGDDIDPWEGEVNIWKVSEVGQWLNFSTFSVIGADAGKISGLTDTWFQVTNMYTDSQCWVARNYTEYRDNSTDSIALKFGLKHEALPWAGVPIYDYVGMWGISETPIDQIDDWTGGYTYSVRTWTDQEMGTAWSVDAGALKDSTTWSGLFLEVDLPWTLYYHIRLNMTTMTQNVTVYNDIEMTDINATYIDTFTSGPGNLMESLAYEYLIHPMLNAGVNTGWTGEYISTTEDLDEWFYLVWPNGTIIGGPYDTYDDALEDLDDLLGVNPLEPNPPSQDWDPSGPFTRFRTRLYIWIIGFAMVTGPVMFFAYRRPSGYNFVVGLFIMVIGLGFLIAAGSV